MVQTRNIGQHYLRMHIVCVESVLYNSDSLFNIASYLPSEGLLNLALTCRRFGIAPRRSDGGDRSLIEETARRIVQYIATDEEKNALPGYDEDNWLCKYNYLRLLRAPLTFDQLAGRIDYVEGNKSCVANRQVRGGTVFSNNIMMTGKHYVSFEVGHGPEHLFLGVMRPGEAMQSADGVPVDPSFYEHFIQRKESVQYNNSVNCCMYDTFDGECCSSSWERRSDTSQPWDGMDLLPSPCKIGMLLDLDEGTLTVYNNGRKLGLMKRGLAGHYCWVVWMAAGGQVTIKRETVPAS